MAFEMEFDMFDLDVEEKVVPELSITSSVSSQLCWVYTSPNK